MEKPIAAILGNRMTVSIGNAKVVAAHGRVGLHRSPEAFFQVIVVTGVKT